MLQLHIKKYLRWGLKSQTLFGQKIDVGEEGVQLFEWSFPSIIPSSVFTSNWDEVLENGWSPALTAVAFKNHLVFSKFRKSQLLKQFVC